MRSVMMALLMLSTCVYAQTRIRAVYINLSTGVLANCVPRYNTSTQLFDCVPVSASITLSGDVTGAASATVVALVGGRSAASVASTVDTVTSATSLATASTLVRRDASGNFAANLITGSLIGNASSATALSVAPFICPSGQFARGVTVNGDAIGCASGGGGGGGTWGSITGTLSSQTDLQSALNLKAGLSSPSFTGDPQVPNVSSSDSDGSAVNSASAQAMIDAKTLGFVSGDALKVGRVNAAGNNTEFAEAASRVAPITFSNPGNTITTGWCQVRYLPRGGRIGSIHFASINPTNGAAVTGSASITFEVSADTGVPSFSSIGTSGITSASQAKDTTLSGFTIDIPANRILKACVASATSVQHLVVSPEVW